MKPNLNKRLAILVAGAAALSACGGDNNDSPNSQIARSPNANALRMFSVEVVNLTNRQPLSPAAVVVHEPGYMGWQEGSAASAGLEMLAEGGSPTEWLAAAAADMYVDATAAAGAPIGPGAMESVMISAPQSQTLQLTLATMLVHTNDAFAGVKDVLIGDLQKDASKTVFAHTFDAGTEANTETMASIPGPDFSGAGFDAMRDDRNFVSIHPGVVSKDDGLTSSDLTEAHRFENVTAKIVIKRLQ